MNKKKRCQNFGNAFRIFKRVTNLFLLFYEKLKNSIIKLLITFCLFRLLFSLFLLLRH